jgi:uncharacterized protein (TIGR03435 family)
MWRSSGENQSTEPVDGHLHHQRGAVCKNARCPWLGRSVVDKTGLTALFEIHVDTGPMKRCPTPEPPGPSIFTAVREQLGLRLDSGRGPGEFLVIDRIERPTPN